MCSITQIRMIKDSIAENRCEQLAVSGVQSLTPYQPGKPISELARELGITSIVKLASNENPLGPSPKVVEKLQQELTDINRYPDGSGFELKNALASKLKISVDQITLGNGSNDVLEVIARTFLAAGEKAVYSQHAFAVYPLIVQAIGALGVCVPASDGTNGPCFGHDLVAMAFQASDNCKMVFIANPNNPTGTYSNDQSLQRFVDAIPSKVIIVIDEAYYEYIDAQDYPHSLALLQSHPNLIITRTFSKAYGLAGLRVGYSVSSAGVAGLLNRVRQPFNVNSLALAAAHTAVNDADYVQMSKRLNKQGLTQLSKGFEDLNVDYISSVGNFICFNCGHDNASVFNRLLTKGIIVRRVDNYQLPQYLRVSVGLEDENSRFLDALKTVLQSK